MDAQTILQIATPIVVPLIIAGMKWLKPNIPTWLLPIVAPVLGGSLDFFTNLALQNQGNIWMAALLGLAGVGVREVIDQLKPAPQPIE